MIQLQRLITSLTDETDISCTSPLLRGSHVKFLEELFLEYACLAVIHLSFEKIKYLLWGSYLRGYCSEGEQLLLSRVLKCTSCRRTQNKTDMSLLTFLFHVMHIVVSHDILSLYLGKVKVQNRFNGIEYAWSWSTSGKQIIAPSHHHFLYLKYGLYGKLQQLKRTAIQVPIKINYTM